MSDVARRLAARFALLGFGLFHIPLLLNNFPTLGGGGFRETGLAHDWGHVFGQPGLWIARHMFGQTQPMPYALEGDNGDTTEEFCRLLLVIVLAAVAAGVWTYVDRRRPRAPWVEDALRVLLRYSIILGLASYAIGKIYPWQFESPLDSSQLELRVGEMTPSGLLWITMGYARPYALFGGLAELAVVILLTFRRTSLLGALLCIFVVGNVVMLDFSFFVQVKLYSTMLVLSAMTLVVLDGRPLLDALVLHRATRAAPPRALIASPYRWVVKILFVGGVLASSVVEISSRVSSRPAASSLAGTWNVESFSRDHQDLTATGDPSRWRRVAGGRYFVIRLESDKLVFCESTIDEGARTVKLKCSDKHRGDLRWTQTGSEIRLEGTFDDNPVVATLRQLPPSLLERSEFEWTMD